MMAFPWPNRIYVMDKKKEKEEEEEEAYSFLCIVV
jgi:hypothetical protein